MAKQRKKESILDVIDRDMKADPDFRKAVEARLMEIRLEHALVKLRERAGLSQVQLARWIKRSQPWIAQAESRSASNMQLSTLATLVAATGGSLHLTVRDAGGKKVEAVELTA